MPYDSPYDPIFQAAGQEWNVDPLLLKAISLQESSGNPNIADSKAGAQGLMQFMPDTAKSIGVQNTRDPVQAIYGAAKLMSQNLDQYGSPENALRAYNAGAPSRWNNPETQAYVPKVTAYYKQLAAGQQAPAGSATAAPAAAPPAAPPAAASAAPADTDSFFANLTGAPVPSAKGAAPAQPATNGAPLPGGGGVTAEGAVTNDPAVWARWQAEDAAKAQPSLVSLPTDDFFGKLTAGASAQSKPSTISPTSNPIRDMLAPDPAYTYGNVLPLAKNNTTGQISLAIPGMVRDLGTGLGDLIYGPMTGTVSPQATMALASGLVPGVTRNPMAQFGSATGEAAAPAVAAAQIEPTLGASPSPSLPAVPDNAAANRLAVSAPAPVNQLAAAPAGRVEPTFTQPGAPAAAPAPAPAPQSVGAAATPTNMTPMGAREGAASQATAENFRLNNPTKSGPDPTIYVPGTQPTLAEIAGDPLVSQEHKVTEQAPGNSAPFVERQRLNNEARLDYYDNLAGTPTTVNRLIEARSDQAQQDLAAAFGNKKPTDAAPVANTIANILSNPRDAENTQVQKYVAPLLDRLIGDDGALKSDPEALYGIREDVARMMSKTSQAGDPNLSHVTGQLADVKTALDAAIENGAPGYRQYLDNYATASRPIDVSQLLLDARPGLTNGADRMMTFQKFDRFMRDVVSDRQAPGLNQAKSIPDDTMDQLWNLHADLARKQNLTLGDARGSPTSMMNRAVKAGVGVAAHGAAAVFSPVVGNLLVHKGAEMLNSRAVAKTTNRLLNPDMGSFQQGP